MSLGLKCISINILDVAIYLKVVSAYINQASAAKA